MTVVGSAGVAFLLGSFLLQVRSRSRVLLQLSTVLAVTGRLIAPGSLGMVVLFLVLYMKS